MILENNVTPYFSFKLHSKYWLDAGDWWKRLYSALIGGLCVLYTQHWAFSRHREKITEDDTETFTLKPNSGQTRDDPFQWGSARTARVISRFV